MKKIATAFIWSLIMSFLAGCFFGWAAVELGYNFWAGPGLTVGITVIHGWLQSRAMLLKALGERKQPAMAITGRHIPVTAGDAIARFESAIQSRQLNLEIESQLTVTTPTGIVISEQEIKDFIGRAWSSQLRGKKALSRVYWTKHRKPPWDREEYDAVIYCLVSNGFIQGRGPGKSGKLTADYKTIVNTLKRGQRG